MLSARWRAAAVAAVALPLLGACTSGGSTEASASPSPSGASNLTAQGSELELGGTATVEYSPDDNRSTELAITVSEVRKGPVGDFVLFDLDATAKAASYYYVTMTIANAGDGTVGGDAVPIWGVDPDDVLLPPVSFGSPFEPCPSAPLPARFKPGASRTMCLVYQVADHGDLKALSYRPDQSFDPIVWSPVVLTK